MKKKKKKKEKGKRSKFLDAGSTITSRMREKEMGVQERI